MTKRSDNSLLIFDVVIVAVSVAAILLTGARYGRAIEADAMGSTGFFTTEWRLLKELKESTDRALAEKDLELDELRARYRALERTGASASQLYSVGQAIREAEEGRAAILSARVMAYSAPDEGPAEPGAARARATLPAASPAAAAASVPDTATLLGTRIIALEGALREAEARNRVTEAELDAARAALSEAVALDAAAAARRAGDELPGEKSSVAPALAAASSAAPLVAEELERLRSAAPVIGLAELRTRALLRAIVRDPAIRAEYPELLDSLDTYLERVEQDAYLRGRAAAYEDLLERLGTRE